MSRQFVTEAVMVAIYLPTSYISRPCGIYGALHITARAIRIPG